MVIQNKMQDNNTTAPTVVASEESITAIQLRVAHDAMTAALMLLREDKIGSREHSLALTKLEEAMMWNNKDRTNNGFLKPYNTHA